MSTTSKKSHTQKKRANAFQQLVKQGETTTKENMPGARTLSVCQSYMLAGVVGGNIIHEPMHESMYEPMHEPIRCRI